MNPSRLHGRSILAFTGALAALAGAGGCTRDDPRKPLVVDPRRYRQVVAAFFTGTIALSVNNRDLARRELTRATLLVPDEPASWANLGLLAIRSQDYEAADEAFRRAEEHSLPNGPLTALRALLQASQGHNAEAIASYHESVRLDPADVMVRYSLVEELRRQSDPAAETKVQQQLEAILKAQPGNLVASLDLAQHAIKSNHPALFRQCLEGITRQSPAWPPDKRAYLAALEEAVRKSGLAAAVAPLQTLRNVLKQVPQWKVDYDALIPANKELGRPLGRFLRLPNPPPTAAAPDERLTFRLEPAGAGPVEWAAAMELQPGLAPGGDPQVLHPPGPDGPPILVTCTRQELVLGTAPPARLPFPGGKERVRPESVLAIDWNNDFRPDLACAGEGGLRLYEQGARARWTDVTARSMLPAGVLKGRYWGAWAVDIDLDGDLDIALGSAAARPTVLRNNGDRTWTVIQPFAGLEGGLRAFAWSDLDEDADPDVCGLAPLLLFQNERGGYYNRLPLKAGRPALALVIADIDQDARLDLVLLREDGAIEAIRHPGMADEAVAQPVARSTFPVDGGARLLCGDLDNNGAVDLVLSGSKQSQVWLADPDGRLKPLGAPLAFRAVSIVDLDGDGRLDLVGVTPDGAPVRALNGGKKPYSWQVFRPRGLTGIHESEEGQATRINTFGLGGDAELRAGLLLQRQPLTGPTIHFGLGENPVSNTVRLFWPNGEAQAEFNQPAEQTILAEQRLDKSCPWLFAWNGASMGFVTDILWRSGLGIRINAQQTAGVVGTREWVKVRRDQLAARDGGYDLRITAELWETHFFDSVALMTVDHPAGTEIFVDERFSAPPPPLAARLTGPPVSPVRVTDDRGIDVTDRARSRDGRHIDGFGPPYCQGVARDHWIEVELPARRNGAGPEWLIAAGWLRPTDSSLNVALGQGRHPQPRGLSLEVPDGRGGWRAARLREGFPAGKNKTLLFNLAGLFPSTHAEPRRLRLRTTMEIYWDWLAVGEGLPDSGLAIRVLAPGAADLHGRGYSVVRAASPSSPEIPDYQQVVGTAPRWNDLTGYHTRFGDVRELLGAVDDRYVIMNAGDELALRFAVPPPPPPGQVRDFVFISDGWEKDGDFNTGFSRTVLPLPSHAEPAYNRRPGRLEDEPVYRRYPADWRLYHTRYVAPDALRNLLRPDAPLPRAAPGPAAGRP